MAVKTKATTKPRATKTTKATKAKATKAKATKAKPAAKTVKKEAPAKAERPSMPAISRPRGNTKEAFGKYMSSVSANFDHRLKEVQALYDEGKCPYKVVQHFNNVLKELAYMEKRILPLAKSQRRQVDKSNNILMKKVPVSPQLAKFLKLRKGEMISRSEGNTAVTMYINIKDRDSVAPEKKKWVSRMNPKDRNLQDPENGSIIHPDKALSDLLDYPAYQARVAAGEHFWKRINKETREEYKVAETDDRLTYSVIQHLLAPHYNWKSDDSADDSD